MVVYSHVIAETNLFRGWYSSWPRAEMWDIEASPLLVCGCFLFFFFLHTLRSPHFPKEGPLRPLTPLAPLLSGSFLGGDPHKGKRLCGQKISFCWLRPSHQFRAKLGVSQKYQGKILGTRIHVFTFLPHLFKVCLFPLLMDGGESREGQSEKDH